MYLFNVLEQKKIFKKSVTQFLQKLPALQSVKVFIKLERVSQQLFLSNYFWTEGQNMCYKLFERFQMSAASRCFSDFSK